MPLLLACASRRRRVTKYMNVSTKNQSPWAGAAALRSATAFVGFALLGLLLSMAIFRLFARFGVAGTSVLVVAIPFAVVIAAGALPELIGGARSLARSFGWQEWVWALLFISAMTFEVRNLHETLNQPLDKFVAVRLGAELIVAMILAWRIVSGKSSLQYLFTGVPRFLAVYGLVCLASTAWSIVPIWTFFKAAEYSLDVVAAALIFESATTSEDFLKVLNWTWIVYALETGWAWLGGIVSPATAWDDLGRLSSVFPYVGPNGIGSTGAVLALVGISRLLWHDRRGVSRSWYWAVIAYGFASMYVSHTRHAIGGFVLGLIVILILAKRTWLLLALSSTVIPLLALTPIGAAVVTYLRRGQDDAAIRALTGRTDFWGVAWEQLSHHPLTGLGAYAGGRFAVMEKIGRAEAGSVHSDWVEILVGTSFWGVLALAVVVVGSGWFLFRGSISRRLSGLERDMAVECAGVWAMLTLHSFFNDEFTLHPPLMFMAVIGFAELLRRRFKTIEVAEPRRARPGPEVPSPLIRSHA